LHDCDHVRRRCNWFRQRVTDDLGFPAVVILRGIQVNDEEPYVIWADQYVEEPTPRGSAFGEVDQPARETGRIGRHIQTLINKAHDAGEEVTAYAHNFAFDGSIFYWYYGLEFDHVCCTQRMAAALWPHQSSALWAVAKRTRAGRKGKELTQSKDVKLLNTAQRVQIAKYCQNDVTLCFRILMHCNQYIPNDELTVISQTLKMYLDRPFCVDRPQLKKFKEDEVTLRQEKIVAAMKIDPILNEKTLASSAKFAEWILSQGIDFEKIASPTRTNPDNLKYPLGKDADEFKQLRVNYPEFTDVWNARLAVASNIKITRAKRILEHSEICKTNPDGRMGFLLQTYGAGNTLRWSGGNKVNGQNLTKKTALRTALTAPEGMVVAVLDQSNIEARVLAWLARETQLLEGFKNKIDLYCQFASNVYGREITKADTTERFVGKTCILGLGYQMGAVRLRTTLALGAMGPAVHITYPQARKLVMTYRSRYKAITHLWHEADGVLQTMINMAPADPPVEWRGLRIRKDSIVLPNDMVLSYPQIRNVVDPDTGDSQVTYRGKDFWVKLFPGKIIENIIQALSRVIIASNMLDATKTLKDIDSKGQLGLLCHDEIVTIVEEEKAQEYLDLLTTVMRTPPVWCSEGNLTLDAEGGFARSYIK
jgi:DNA polymerase